MTRVLLAEDHTVLREGLRRALEGAGLTVAGEAGDGEAAVVLTQRLLPDVVLMDVSLPGLDGIEATRRLRDLAPGVRVVILTMFDDAATVAAAAAAGAVGYLVKDCSTARLIGVVRAVASGATLLDPVPPARRAERAKAGQTLQLSKREIEVLQLVGAGASTAEVARSLFLSVRTVKNHLASIYAKLEVRDRTQAVVKGLRLGIIEWSESAREARSARA